MEDMLGEIGKSVKKNYYDPNFRGIDIDARYHEYNARLEKAGTPNEAFHIIAAFPSGFHDSHLFFIPPNRNLRFDSGYRMEMVGDRCFVTMVKPKTDAFEKLHPGDEIAHFQGYTISRDDSMASITSSTVFHHPCPLSSWISLPSTESGAMCRSKALTERSSVPSSLTERTETTTYGISSESMSKTPIGLKNER